MLNGVKMLLTVARAWFSSVKNLLKLILFSPIKSLLPFPNVVLRSAKVTGNHCHWSHLIVLMRLATQNLLMVASQEATAKQYSASVEYNRSFPGFPSANKCLWRINKNPLASPVPHFTVYLQHTRLLIRWTSTHSTNSIQRQKANLTIS